MSAGIPGLSTQHYLWVNDAISKAVEKPRGGPELFKDLSRLPDHREVLERACPHGIETPDQKLVRLSQSSIYLGELAAQPVVRQSALSLLSLHSGIVVPTDLMSTVRTVDQMPHYSHVSMNVDSEVVRLRGALLNFVETMGMDKVHEPFAKIMDIILPQVNLLFGSLLVYGGLEHRIHVQKLAGGIPAQTWFDVCYNLLKSMSVLNDLLSAKIHAMNDENLVQTAGLPMAVLEGNQFGQVYSVVVALRKGLDVLIRQTAIWVGNSAKSLNAKASAVQTKSIIPLVKHLSTVASETDAARLRKGPAS